MLPATAAAVAFCWYWRGSKHTRCPACASHRICLAAPSCSRTGHVHVASGLAPQFMFVIFMSTCWGMVQPTEYGLLRNGISGQVDLETVYESGRHYIGWGYEFLVFPRKFETMTVVVSARTGPGEDDASSGGQPVTLDVSFQYEFDKADIPDLYRTFAMTWETSYRRFASQAITNVAQQFTPFSFWQRRRAVETAFFEAVNATLLDNGFAHVRALQLVSVSFQRSYETTIVNIQLQEQLGVTRRYELEATAVDMDITVLQAQTDATIATINAEAARESSVIINRANTIALQREQAAKANMYSQIRQHLNWTQPQFLEYIRIKSLNSQSSEHVKLAMDPVGNIAS